MSRFGVVLIVGHNADTTQIPETLMEVAAVWFARMRGPEASKFQSEFDDWTGQHSLNQFAYRRVGEIFAVARFSASECASHLQSVNDDAPKISTICAATPIDLPNDQDAGTSAGE